MQNIILWKQYLKTQNIPILWPGVTNWLTYKTHIICTNEELVPIGLLMFENFFPGLLNDNSLIFFKHSHSDILPVYIVTINIYTFCRYLFKMERFENKNRQLKIWRQIKNYTCKNITDDQIYFKNIPLQGLYCEFC